jgi:hypothetical protein
LTNRSAWFGAEEVKKIPIVASAIQRNCLQVVGLFYDVGTGYLRRV